ncbi:MAG: hypothetical protein CML24_14665 [Rhizobiales bacterium]|nr:hypothetical protein [Hyphomicrobiales bacterium]|tara:strand:+ start:5429 stop:5746 length:318 start_codon:yes stop_codon:yes gene_type:complete
MTRMHIVHEIEQHVIRAFQKGDHRSPQFETQLLRAAPEGTVEEWNSAIEGAVRHLVKKDRWALLRIRFLWPVLRRMGLLSGFAESPGEALSHDAIARLNSPDAGR